MQRVVPDIHSLPGFSRFLLPSLFPDLQRAANGGPVIIVSASNYSCDTLIIFPDRDPVHIPLRVTQEDVLDLSSELHTLTVRAKRFDVTRELASFLRKLWDQIVSPIVDCLQTTYPFQSRIWWCPTAGFFVLPLHAAGPHRKGQQNLPHLYILSYPPTLTALIRARRECGDAVDALTNVVQFRAYEKELALAGSFGLTDGMKRFGPVVEFDGSYRVSMERNLAFLGSSKSLARTNGSTLHVMVSQLRNGRSSPRSLSTTGTLQSNVSSGAISRTPNLHISLRAIRLSEMKRVWTR